MTPIEQARAMIKRLEKLYTFLRQADMPGATAEVRDAAACIQSLITAVEHAEREALERLQKPDAATVERIQAAVADALGDAYDCQHVWSAWSYGTMGPDDFALVAEDPDRVAEIADAAIRALITGKDK